MDQKISRYQLFVLTMLLEIGSTTLFALGINADQDAWLIILFALIPGFFMNWIYTQLNKNYPQNNFGQIIVAILGKALGIPLIILYCQYYMFQGVQVFTEFSELIIITLMPQVPRLIILIIFMTLVVYVLCLGIEVFARTAELMFPVVITFLVLIYLLSIVMGNIDLNQLLPVLGKGFTLDIAFELLHITSFPYGDFITMLMLWMFVDSKEDIRKISYLALGLSGALLSISLVFIISVLGAKFASIATVPLVEVARLINIADIIENIDVMAIIIIFIGGFFKASMYLYAAVLILKCVLKNVNIKYIITALGTFSVIYGDRLIKSFPFHKWIGNEVNTKYLHPPFMMIIPVLLLFINWIKKRKGVGISGEL